MADMITAGTLYAISLYACNLEGASGTFAQLITGDPDAAYMMQGSDEYGEPYISFYDTDGTKVCSIRKDGLYYGEDVVQRKFTLGNRTGIGVFIIG